MDREAVRAFARRDRRALEDLEAEERHRRFELHGSAESVRLSRALWARVRALRPDWPDRRTRDDDLRAHFDLKRTLDRAGRAFAVR